MPSLIPLLIFLTILAAIFDAGLVASVVYFLVAVGLFVRWWVRRVPTILTYRRRYDTHLFHGESATVTLELQNHSAIAIPWLQFSERLPLRLGYTSPHTAAAYLPGRSTRHLRYTVRGSRRGLYYLGPLTLSYGDIFGFEDRILRDPGADRLVVYPKIIPLERLLLPSRAPLGALRSRNPLSEDPSRVIGVRDYQLGDSLRRIHWPASARIGKLQVKKLEPAMTLQTILLLDLHPESYERQLVDHYMELSIVAAASFANRLIEIRQAVGLVSNGVDPLADGDPTTEAATTARLPPAAPVTVPAGRGRGHLIRLLEVLARIESGAHLPFATLLQRHAYGLGWGTTVVAITGGHNDELMPALAGLKRSGYTVLLITAGGRRPRTSEDGRAQSLNIPVFRIQEDVQLPALAEVARG